MAWIESHTVLTRHRKVLLLAYDLKISVAQTVGHLHAFWHAVLEQQEDGDLTGWPDSMIEEVSLWEGEPGQFVTHLREREWLDGSLVHDWLDYVGPYLMKKYSSGNVQRLKEIWLKHGYKYGKGQGKYQKQKATTKRVESERKERIPFPSLPNPSSPLPSYPDLSSPSSISAEAAPRGKSVQTWEAYRNAYAGRYGTDPIRDAGTNSMLSRLVDKLGAVEAPHVAAFYVTHNDPFYVKKRHPPNLLLQDAGGLRTQWATGVKATAGEGKNASMKDEVVEQVKRVEAMMRRVP